MKTSPSSGEYDRRRRRRHRNQEPGRHMDEGRSVPRSKSRRLHRRPGDPEDRELKANFHLLIGYIVALILFGLTITFFATRPSPKTAATTAPSPPEETDAAQEPPAHPDDADLLAKEEGRRIAEQIATWDRSALYIEEGYHLLEDGKTSRAETRLNAALELTPQNVDLQLALTQLFIKQKRHDEAKNSLMRILEVDAEHEKARILLAQILSAQRNHEAALSVAKWILKTNPYGLEANQVAATGYLQTDRPASAAPHLRKIVNINRDDLLARNNLAVAYSRMGQYKKAIELLDELLKIDESNSVTYYNMAVCYAQYQKTSSAIETLNLASERFGASFVQTWMQSNDFDPIRNDPEFNVLEGIIARESQGGGPIVQTGSVTQGENDNEYSEHQPTK